MNASWLDLHPLDLTAIVVYTGLVVAVGIWVGRFTKTTHDFFLGGQRFSWWLVGISCAATLVGSYSFIQYAESGFRFGLSLTYPYTNEWIVLPLFLIGWLPIIYYSRVQSIPEYFERRFDLRTRVAVLVLLMIYLEVYIGINLLAIGTLLNGLFGWSVLVSAAVVAVISGLYMHYGGQTSVLITDLLQGLLLLAMGVVVFLLGVGYIGGFERLWEGLPPAHRLPFAQFNHPTGYHAVGDFWNDAVVGTFAFYMINQGVLMRFLSAKSVRDGRKAMLLTVILIMPIAAIGVTGAGWIGRAMVTHEMAPLDDLSSRIDSTDPADVEAVDDAARNIFVTVSRVVCMPGVFGLVIAAVLAALMSTLDTLITAVTAICVNDVWRPLLPNRDDRYYLGVARSTSVVAVVLGLVLIPVFNRYETIYQALSMFTSLIIPPLVVVICLAITWPRFRARAAFWTLVTGSLCMLASWRWPILVQPFSHGVDPADGFPFLRGLFGLVVSSGLALVFTWLDKTPGRESSLDGLVMGRLDQARALYKGGTPSERGIGQSMVLNLHILDDGGDGEIRLPPEALLRLEAEPGDLVHVSDARWWLGGLRSLHMRIGPPSDRAGVAQMAAAQLEASHLLADRPVRVEKMM